MPCNPAVGGTAKGHLVREIDALGGLMGRAIDATGIQFKLLNRSRGPAVWSPRAQADKRRYSAWVQGGARRGATHRLDHRQGRPDPRPSGGRVSRSRARRSANAIGCAALVITTGTFLNGLIHIGREQRPAGRAGEPPSRDLAESLEVVRLTSGDGSRRARPRGSIAGASTSRAICRRGARRRSAGAVLVSDRPDRATADRLPRAAHDRSRSRSGSAQHRRVSALQRTDSRHRSAVLPVARRQGDAVPRTGSGIRSSSSPKDSTSTRSTSTAFR